MRMLAHVALLAAFGCASSVEIRGGAGDPDYDFARLKTYAWRPREATGDPRIDENSLDQRVHASVDENLARKGYRLVTEAADFLVGYRAVVGSQREVEPGQPFEGIWTDEHSPRTANGGGPVDKVVAEGTLVLRVFDARTGNLVWEAAADAEIQPKSGPLAPTTEDKVRVAISKMLERFPP